MPASLCDYLYTYATSVPVNLEIDPSADRVDVIQYITNPSVYYTQRILNTPGITFKIESVYKRLLGLAPEKSDECVVVIYPIHKDNQYLNSCSILRPIIYIDKGKRIRRCANCFVIIPKRKDAQKEFDRPCCVSCFKNACRTDLSAKIRKIDYLG